MFCVFRYFGLFHELSFLLWQGSFASVVRNALSSTGDSSFLSFCLDFVGNWPGFFQCGMLVPVCQQVKIEKNFVGFMTAPKMKFIFHRKPDYQVFLIIIPSISSMNSDANLMSSWQSSFDAKKNTLYSSSCLKSLYLSNSSTHLISISPVLAYFSSR